MRTLIYCISALLLFGCASESFTTGTKQLSRAFVERNLVRGKTTKSEVRALLGDPQTVVSGKLLNVPGAPAETWSYVKQFHRDASEKGFGYAVVYSMANPASGGFDRIETSVLIVQFDDSGRVTGHMFSNSAAGMPR